MDVDSRLTGVFRTVFNDESMVLDDATNAADIDGWDSIAHVSLIFSIEEEFGIQFSMRQLEAFQNVGDIREAVTAKTGASGG